MTTIRSTAVSATLRVAAGTLGFSDRARILIRATPLVAQHFQRLYPEAFVISAPIVQKSKDWDTDVPICDATITTTIQITQLQPSLSWPPLEKYIRPNLLDDAIIINLNPYQTSLRFHKVSQELRPDALSVAPYIRQGGFLRYVYFQKGTTDKTDSLNALIIPNESQNLIDGYKFLQHYSYNRPSEIDHDLLFCLLLQKTYSFVPITNYGNSCHTTDNKPSLLSSRYHSIEGDSMDHFAYMIESANRLRKEQEATKDAMQESLHQLEQYQKYQRIKPQNRKLLKASKLYEKATLSPVGYSNHNHSGAAVYQSPSTQEYQTFPDDENFN